MTELSLAQSKRVMMVPVTYAESSFHSSNALLKPVAPTDGIVGSSSIYRAGAAMWQNKGGKSVGLLPGRESFGPLALMAITPIFAILMIHTMANLKGDVTVLVAEMSKVGAVCWSHGGYHS